MQAQATHELRRFPIRTLALLSVLIAAMLAAVLVVGLSVYGHRSAAQPASIGVVGTGPTDADALGQVDSGSGGEQAQDSPYPQYLIVDGFTPY